MTTTAAQRKRRTARRRRWAVGAVVAVVVLAGAGAAWATTRSSGPTYRTATASTETVQQTLDSVGTFVPATQADLNFPVSGLVSSVAVTLGQEVSAGTPLASLDTTDFTSNVNAAEATLTEDQSRLAADQAAEEDPSSTSTDPSSSTGTDPSNDPGSGSASSGSHGSAAVTQGQAALQGDLQQAKTALTTVQKDQTAAGTACGVSTKSSGPPGSGDHETADVVGAGQDAAAGASDATLLSSSSTTTSTSSTTTSTSSTTTSTSSTTTPTSSTRTPTSTSTTQPAGTGKGSTGTGKGTRSGTTPAEAACLSAEQATMSAQLGLYRFDQEVELDVSKLVTAIDSLVRSESEAASTGTATSHTGSQSDTASGANGTGAASQTVTPAQIDSDEASIDNADAQLSSSQEALEDATLVSPIAGKVAALDIAPGTEVSAGSTTVALNGTAPATVSDADIVIAGGATMEVRTTATDTQVSELSVGDAVTVVPDGSTDVLHGSVVSVGLLNSSETSTGSVTYPVTIGLTNDPSVIPDTTGQVSIVVRQATGTAVPSSAIHSVGTIALVEELEGGKAVAVPVTVGAQGSAYTQILSGLKPGATVILADLNEGVPTTTGAAAARGLLGGGGGAFRATGGGAAGGGGAATATKTAGA